MQMSELPWLKFIPLGVAFILTLFEALTRRTDRKWLHRFLVPLLSLIALITACWIAATDDRNAQANQNATDLHLNRIEGKLGNEEATKKYLQAVGQLTQQLTAAKTGNSVEKFFSAKDERQKLREQLNETNQKLLLTYEIKINPVRDYILGKFDTWISGIEKRGISVRVSKADVTAVKIGLRDNRVSRSAVFDNGDTAQLQFWSAVINDGHLSENLICRLDRISNRGAENALVFQMFVEESSYRVVATKPQFIYKPYTGNSDNPVEDKAFIEALDQAMAFVIDEATATK
jgi:hypothetical protein